MLNIQLIDKCNLSCMMCNYIDYATHEKISMENLIKVLDQAGSLVINGTKIKVIRLDGNGEALLYPMAT